MSDAKHTPGPWHATANGGDDYDARPLMVCGGRDAELIADCRTHDWIGDDEKVANAKLIATAPDLLARLEQALACFEKWHEIAKHESNMLRLMRKTIAKAKGE